MTDPVQLLIDAGAIPTSPFGPSSRYAGVAIARYKTSRFDPGVPYVRRRFLPRRTELAIAVEHAITSGDRVDLLAAHYLGDPELYWHLVDANFQDDPLALTATPGERIVIPHPPGAAGS